MNRKKIKNAQFLNDAANAVDYTKADVFPDKVPIEKMRLVWNDDKVQYTDEQLYIIRDWMYALATIIIHVGENQQTNTKTIELNPPKNEKSNHLRQGKHRRAS